MTGPVPRPGLPLARVAEGVALGSAVGLVLGLLRAPSPPLFGALVGGVVIALRTPSAPQVPQSVRALGMAIVGVAAGSAVDLEVLRTVLREPVAVLGGVFATLLVTMVIGQLLRLDRDVDGRTAAFASIAGGASGVSIAAREYGADDVIVMSVQYLRVVLTLATIPVVAPLLGHGAGGPGPLAPPGRDLTSELFYTVAAVGLGLLVARLVRFPAAPVLATLLSSAVLAMSGVFDDARAPAAVVTLGFIIIGANVGLGFTRDRVRALVRILPLALVVVALGVVACAAIGLLLAQVVGLSALDGYLATTPGGLPAVVAVAIDSGDAIGLILTMQVVRIFVALACAPLIGWVLRRRSGA